MKKLLSLAGILCSITLTNYAAASTPNNFTLKAPAISNQIPVRYTCDGKNISPKLIWSNIPANTSTLALILSDPDAPTPSGNFYHWVVYNIPPSTSSFAEGISSLPKKSITAKNGWAKAQYNGPCPPTGNTHHYVFTIYALDTSLTLRSDSNASTLIHAMQNHILAQASFTALYGH
jgi:Raf kinase inhibitor-like YbhB/YbcL family protein